MRVEKFLAAAVAFLFVPPVALGQTVTFAENFEGGSLGVYLETNAAGAPTATLWHGEDSCNGVTPIPATMATNAASYNQGDIGIFTYNTGATNSGAIASPVIPSAPSASTTVTFEYSKQTESSGATFDQCLFEWRPAGGSYSTLLQITANSTICPASAVVTISVPAAGPWQHRFRFDTVDSIANGFQGWTVDNVVVREAIFTENFEGGGLGAYVETNAAGAPAATLWHGEDSCNGVTPIPGSMGTNAASYNQGDLGIFDYNTGGFANAGTIESPLIPASVAPTKLSFEYTKQTEGGGFANFDQCFVEWRPAAGAYSSLLQIVGNSVCPSSALASLSVPVSGGTWQHRFRFNTGDGINNDFQGWTVDNVAVTEDPAVFAENFEGGGLGAYVETNAAGTPVATLWHGEDQCDAVTPIPASMGTNAAAYNQGDTGLYNYATGAAANAGAIESPVIASTPNAHLTLSFDYTRETESAAGFDTCWVEARPAGPNPYGVVAQILGTAVCPTAPTSVTTQVCSVPGGAWQHRFRFDTGDGAFNNFRGWYVDNVLAIQSVEVAGSLVTVPTGCGGPPFSTLVAAGAPVIGGTVSLTMGSAAFALMWLGAPSSTPLCPAGCTLGASLGIVLSTSSIVAPVPCDPSLAGGIIAVQGANVLAPGGCGVVPIGIPFTVTDTVVVTIG